MVSTLGNLTQTGALTVGGTSSFTTSATDATIALTSANLLTGAVLLNTSGAGGNAQLTNASATVLGRLDRRRQPHGADRQHQRHRDDQRERPNDDAGSAHRPLRRWDWVPAPARWR